MKTLSEEIRYEKRHYPINKGGTKRQRLEDWATRVDVFEGQAERIKIAMTAITRLRMSEKEKSIFKISGYEVQNFQTENGEKLMSHNLIAYGAVGLLNYVETGDVTRILYRPLRNVVEEIISGSKVDVSYPPAFGSKTEGTMKGIILSANDVIADVLIVNEDEEGTAPIDMRQVELPCNTRDLRQSIDPLEPRYKRGDKIMITSNVLNVQERVSEETISGLILLLADRDECEADAIFKADKANKRFAAEWPNVLRREQEENPLFKGKVS